ncbi:BRISC and BRCA1-A complex member 1-like [Ptychodera flava]|uniref:BRISC and BRCA1-A complex member 1-like n=1 Tax=Ptychodera flava TaxID=63121 RepID=UPI00396A595C
MDMDSSERELPAVSRPGSTPEETSCVSTTDARDHNTCDQDKTDSGRTVPQIVDVLEESSTVSENNRLPQPSKNQPIAGGVAMKDFDETVRPDEEDGYVRQEKFEDDEEFLLSDSSSDTETNDDPRQIVPKVNCPEKIILCLDLSAEMNNTPFVSKDGTRYQSLQMVKRAMTIFVHTKAAMNRTHEFALVVLQDNALWMHNFTSNTEEFCYVLGDLESETEYDSFDMSSLFEVISERTHLPNLEGDIQTIPPPYIIRTVLIYGRSHCMPEFSNGRQVMQSMMQSRISFLMLSTFMNYQMMITTVR